MKNQKGFSAVEGFLILVIVTMIGGVGWYVWKSNQDAKKGLENISQLNVKTPKKEICLTMDQMMGHYSFL